MCFSGTCPATRGRGGDEQTDNICVSQEPALQQEVEVETNKLIIFVFPRTCPATRGRGGDEQTDNICVSQEPALQQEVEVETNNKLIIFVFLRNLTCNKR